MYSSRVLLLGSVVSNFFFSSKYVTPLVHFTCAPTSTHFSGVWSQILCSIINMYNCSLHVKEMDITFQIASSDMWLCLDIVGASVSIFLFKANSYIFAGLSTYHCSSSSSCWSSSSSSISGGSSSSRRSSSSSSGSNIIYLFTAIGLLPGGSGYFTCKHFTSP